MKSKHFMFNAMLLAFASIFAKIIGAFYRIPLTKILGESGIGLYQLAFPVYAFMHVLVTSGIGAAITKLTATYYKENNKQKIKKLLKVGTITITVVAIIMTIILCLLANTLSVFQHEPNLKYAYFLLAPCFLICSYATLTKSYFAGKQNMIPGAMSQLVENVTKLIFGLVFAYLFISKGLIFGVLGAILGVLVSEIFGTAFLLLFALFKRNKRFKKTDGELAASELAIGLNYTVAAQNDSGNGIVSNKPIKSTKQNSIFKDLIKLALPLTLNGAVVPLIMLLDSLVVIKFFVLNGYTISTATDNFGLLYGVINSLVNMPVVIAVAIGAALMPSITSVFSKDDHFILKSKVKEAFNYTFFIALPFVILFALFSKSILGILYGGILNTGLSNFLLCVSSISILSLSVLQVSSSILIGINKFWWQVFSITLASVLKIIAEFTCGYLGVLTPELLAILNVLTFAFAAMLNVFKIKQTLNINLLSEKNKLAYTFSIGAMWLTYFLAGFVMQRYSGLLFLFIAGGVAVFVYLAIMIIFKVVEVKGMFKRKNKV